MSDSVRPRRRQPIRLHLPWDSPGKNIGVGYHFLLQCMKFKSESEVTQSCLTLSNPMDCSLPGSSVHGSLQARVLEWGAIAFSGLLSYSRLIVFSFFLYSLSDFHDTLFQIADLFFLSSNLLFIPSSAFLFQLLYFSIILDLSFYFLFVELLTVFIQTFEFTEHLCGHFLTLPWWLR